MNKQVGRYPGVFLVVASMLGTGILTTTGIILSLVKTPSAALGVWLLGGILALVGAWCYGELARRVPRNGGEATILRELLSPALGEVAGLTSFVVGFAAANAATSLAFVDYLGDAIAGADKAPHVLACAVLLLMTSVHGLFGAVGLHIQTLLATVKFALLAALAVYGLVFAMPLDLALVANTAGQTRAAAFGTAWGQAMMLVMFAYSGWNAVIYVAGEVHEPVRNVRRILMTGTAIIVVLYIAVNVVLLAHLPAQELEGVRPVVAVLIRHYFGSHTSAVFSGLVAFALLSSLGVSAFLGPRVLASMLYWLGPKVASDQAPRPLIRPWLVWLQAGLSIAMVLSGTFVQILTVMGFLLGLFPILCILCLYRRPATAEAATSGLIRYVLAPVFVVVSSVVLVLGAWQSPMEVLMALSLVGVFYLLRLFASRYAQVRAFVQ